MVVLKEASEGQTLCSGTRSQDFGPIQTPEVVEPLLQAVVDLTEDVVDQKQDVAHWRLIVVNLILALSAGQQGFYRGHLEVAGKGQDSALLYAAAQILYAADLMADAVAH